MIGAIIVTATIIALGALVAFWPTLLEYLNFTLRPFIERLIGKENADRFGSLLNFLDKRICLVRSNLRSLWRMFEKSVLRIRSKYIRVSSGVYNKQTETMVRTGPSTARRIVTEESVYYDQMPEGVRDAIIRSQASEAVCDDKELIAERMRQQCAESGYDVVEIMN